MAAPHGGNAHDSGALPAINPVIGGKDVESRDRSELTALDGTPLVSVGLAPGCSPRPPSTGCEAAPTRPPRPPSCSRPPESSSRRPN